MILICPESKLSLHLHHAAVISHLVHYNICSSCFCPYPQHFTLTPAARGNPLKTLFKIVTWLFRLSYMSLYFAPLHKPCHTPDKSKVPRDSWFPLTLLPSSWPLCCSSNTPGLLLSQDLWTFSLWKAPPPDIVKDLTPTFSIMFQMLPFQYFTTSSI